MKRWNGWGTDEYTYHFAPSAQAFVERIVGKGQIVADASLETESSTPNSPAAACTG